nr:phage integrase SAM-like domain and Arm DNA-binding domain-containing protein [uncultured Allomuricauda sp.]
MLSLLFYLRKYKTDRVGRSMIYVRITVNGERSEFSTRRKIHPSQWDAAYGKVLGFSQEVRQLNSQLSKIRTDLYRHADILKGREQILTAESLKEYLQKELRKKDIPVNQVDYAFNSGFEYYLKTKRKCSHNTAIKYVVNFKKIVRIAYANGWISKDPFANRKARLKIVEREF